MVYKKFIIAGKNRGVAFGLKATLIYCEKMGGDIEQVDKIFSQSQLVSVQAVCTMVWAGMVAYCELTGADLDFSLAQVEQSIGDMEQKLFDDLYEEFKKSKFFGRTIADYYYTPIEQDVADKGGKASKKKPSSLPK